MVGISETFTPILVKGLVVHPDKPLNFEFIVDTGNDATERSVIKEQSERIVRYFLAALTVPEDQLWVNLSPYEKDRIIADELGQTVLGRDMLSQDYVLKQLTASLIYPEAQLGKDFWAKIYKEAEEKFGITDIPVDTFNKVWIVPQKAVVFEKDDAVYVTEAKLKVMLDSDYVAAQVTEKEKRDGDVSSPSPSAVSGSMQNMAKQIVREVVLPAIEREVNTGKNFATLRQVYYAAILAGSSCRTRSCPRPTSAGTKSPVSARTTRRSRSRSTSATSRPTKRAYSITLKRKATTRPAKPCPGSISPAV
jgi:hypothetical protein